jgi:hypothetical protein
MYKAVRLEPIRHLNVTKFKKVSLLIDNKNTQVEYKKDEFVSPCSWMVPLGYGITVFDTLNNLYRFLNINFNRLCSPIPVTIEIWRCECEREMESRVRRYVPSFINKINEPDDFYLKALECEYVESISSTEWPDGTLMFYKVKLIERIDTIQVGK